MTIPTIAPYELPKREELPGSKIPWRPDPARAVLLIHDMQRYFVNFFDRGQSPVPTLIGNLQTLRNSCVLAGVPVVYSAQPADPVRARRGLLNDVWGPGLTAHPDKATIVPELAPRPEDVVLEKTRYSAFQGTQLLSFLREQGRDQLWIGGLYAHIGCMLTAAEAFMHDIQPFLIADALADFSREHHDMALQFVAGRCGVVTWSGTLRDALPGLTEPRDRIHQRPPETTRAADRLLLRELSRLLEIGEDALHADDELRAIGLDSVRMMDLAESLNAQGVALGAADLMECQTLRDLTACVAAQNAAVSSRAACAEPA